jgi:hypothetical protein
MVELSLQDFLHISTLLVVFVQFPKFIIKIKIPIDIYLILTSPFLHQLVTSNQL